MASQIPQPEPRETVSELGELLQELVMLIQPPVNATPEEEQRFNAVRDRLYKELPWQYRRRDEDFNDLNDIVASRADQEASPFEEVEVPNIEQSSSNETIPEYETRFAKVSALFSSSGSWMDYDTDGYIAHVEAYDCAADGSGLTANKIRLLATENPTDAVFGYAKIAVGSIVPYIVSDGTIDAPDGTVLLTGYIIPGLDAEYGTPDVPNASNDYLWRYDADASTANKYGWEQIDDCPEDETAEEASTQTWMGL